VAGLVALGAVLFLLLDRALHDGVPTLATAGPPGTSDLYRAVTSSSGLKRLLPVTMAGDAIHNVVDGMLIAAAYMDNPSLGLLTGAAIALHELPRELGTFAILVRGGRSVGGALLFNALTAAGAIAGAVATLAIGTRVSAVGSALVPIAAGNFLYLSMAIALGEYRASRSPTDRAARLGMALLGFLLTSVRLGH
jgi:zinc transporter ZupT